MSTDAAPRPYSGIRVLDLTKELGAYASRMFADLGAEVIRIEDKQYRNGRMRHPLIANGDHPEGGGVGHAFLNINKKSVVLDLQSPSGKAVLKDLVATSEIVFFEPGAYSDEEGRETSGITVADLAAVPGPRILTVISYFGLSGPYSNYVGTDLVAQALGGIAWLSGEPDKPPLQLAGQQSIFVASLYAATATAIALWDSEASGHSHILDVSAQEAIAHSLQNAVQVYDLEKRISSRGGEGVRDATEAAFACKDGYVFLAAPLSLPASWNGVRAWMEEEHFLEVARLREPDWADRPTRCTAAMRMEFKGIFERFIANKTKQEMRDNALKRKLVMAPVSTLADLQADPQLIYRQYFQSLAMPHRAAPAMVPGAPYRLSEPLWSIDRAAPDPGQDQDSVLGQRAAGIGASGGQH